MRTLVSLLLLACLTACGNNAPPASLNTGMAAPTFETRTPDGQAVSFPAQFTGRPVVIRFWADWCKFCESEMRAIGPLINEHSGKGLAILAVNVGQDPATVTAYMKKLGVSYPAILDEKANIAKSYGVAGLPTSFFIDAQGIVQSKTVGESDAKLFEQQLKTILH